MGRKVSSFKWGCVCQRQNGDKSMNNKEIKILEAKLWDTADELRANSKLTSNQYCMPVMGLIFLRYAYSRFEMVKEVILKEHPSRPDRPFIVKPEHFKAKSALFLKKEAQYRELVNLQGNVKEAGWVNTKGEPINSLGEAINNAMELIEQQSEQLSGVLPKTYTIFSDDLLNKLLKNFDDSALDDVGGDILGRIYEYFLGKFSTSVAEDDGVFFTPKSLVRMIVNVIEPESGILLDPACGSGSLLLKFKASFIFCIFETKRADLQRRIRKLYVMTQTVLFHNIGSFIEGWSRLIHILSVI